MDIDSLLAPISEDSPCGEDMSFSTEFDAILESRRSDDASLDQGEWVTTLKVADWPGVQSSCEQLLVKRTKDLRVASWLTEAEARQGGYAGLASGLEIVGGLCETYWIDVHPRIAEDGDSEERSGSLRWLLAQVQSMAKQMPVLRQGARTFSLVDMETAQANARNGVDVGGGGTASLTPELIASARSATPQPFFASNFADAERALKALEKLQTAVDAALGEDGPAFGPPKRALEDAVHSVKLMARDGDPQFEDDASPGEGVPGAATPGGGSGPLKTRADALRQLRGVADFFRRTEPHSPVAYLAERAAQWGDMPLHAWLRSVVKDEGTLAQMEELLGVPKPPTPSEE